MQDEKTKAGYPDFLPGGVPIRAAAAIYGKTPVFIIDGIREGWLPVGHANGRYGSEVYISPLKVWEDTGFLYLGQVEEEIRAMQPGRKKIE